MKIAFPAALLFLALCMADPADAGPPSGSYPRVYGPTGRPYGPTQAEYQYQRQYGRPWHGANGIPGGVGSGFVNGYPWGGGRHYHAHSCFFGPSFYPPVYYGGYGYGGYDYGYGGFSNVSPWPSLNPVQPQIPAEHQAVMQEWLQDERQQWTSPLESMPVEQLPKRFIKPSTDAAKARSVRSQHAGDLQFQALNYSAALSDYQQALMSAQDRSEPYFRLGLANAAISDFDDAVLNLKLGLQLDNDWPQTGPQLVDLFGEHNQLPKTQFKHRVLNWVQEDIRDPDRLFLIGVLLYMDDDAERAAEVFEAAARLGGMKQHLHAFLSPPADSEPVALPGPAQKPAEAPPAPGIDDDQLPAKVVPTPPVRPRLGPVENIVPPPLPK